MPDASTGGPGGRRAPESARRPSRAGARLVDRRATSIAAAWTESAQLGPSVPVALVLRAVVAALRRCEGMSGGHHVHAGADQIFSDLDEEFAGIDAAAVSALREIIRAHAVNDLRPDEAMDALLCSSVVLDELLGAVTEKRTHRIEGLAYIDELTRLGNRRAADESLDRLVATASRHSRPLTVAVIDVDGLKAVNDSEGHPAGDAVLRAMADALRLGLREGDAAFRTGGDEFLMLLPETEPDDAVVVLQRVAASGAPRFSFGIAGASEASGATAVVALADQRLLQGRWARRGEPEAPLPTATPRRRRRGVLVPAVAAALAALILLVRGPDAGLVLGFAGWAIAGALIVKSTPMWSAWRPVAAILTSGALVTGALVVRPSSESPPRDVVAAPGVTPSTVLAPPAASDLPPLQLPPRPTTTTTALPTTPSTTVARTVTPPASAPPVTTPTTTPTTSPVPTTTPRPRSSTTTTTTTTTPPGPSTASTRKDKGKHRGWRNNHPELLETASTSDD